MKFTNSLKFLLFAICLLPAHQVFPGEGDSIESLDVPSKQATIETQFENEWIRVWKTAIPMEEPIKMQRFEKPRVIIALNGGILHKIEQNGAMSDYTLSPGQAYWLSADPPGKLHAEVNPSADPLELIVIELQTPSKS